MKLKQGTSSVVHYFDSTAAVGQEAFVAKVYSPADALLHTLVLSPVLAVPDLYLSAAFIPADEGRHKVVYSYGDVPAVVHQETLDIVSKVFTDHPVEVAVSLLLDDRVVGGNNRVVYATVYDIAGEVVLAAALAPYDNATGTYVRSAITFPSVGQYFVVWTHAANAQDLQLPVQVDHVHITRDMGLETVRFVAGTVVGDDYSIGANGAPHTDAVVVLSTEAGVQVAQATVDAEGLAQVEVAAATYIVSIRKDGQVFSLNNWEIMVRRSQVTPTDPLFVSWPGTADVQSFQLISDVFSPTFTTPASPASLCVLYADIYKMDGTPLHYADVYVRLLQKPELFSGTAVFDTQKVYRTDSNGHVEFSLVQGISVEVAVAPLSLRRVIVVPSGAGAASPVNLMTLLSSADDVFDVIEDSRPAAPRRSL